VLDDGARPPGSQESEYLLEHVAPARSLQTQGLALAGLIDPRHKAEQQAAARELVKLGQILGQKKRVAAQRHHVGAEPQTAGSSGDQRQTKQRIKSGRERKVRQPHAVKSAGLQRICECEDTGSGQRAAVGGDSEANLHSVWAKRLSWQMS
jgi:hypothetical protein